MFVAAKLKYFENGFTSNFSISYEANKKKTLETPSNMFISVGSPVRHKQTALSNYPKYIHENLLCINYTVRNFQEIIFLILNQ